MNRAVTTSLDSVIPSDSVLADDYEEASNAGGEDYVAKAIECLRRWWWYFAIVVIVSAGAAVPIALEFGTETYTAIGQVKVSPLPQPPGESVYQPPNLSTFQQHMGDPRVLERVFDKYAVIDPDRLREPPFKTSSERGSEVATVTLEWDDAEEAIAMVNDVIGIATEQSVKDRLAILSQSEKFYQGLLQSADLNTANLKAGRRKKVEELRSEFRRSADQRNDYESLESAVASRQDRVDALIAERRRAERLLEVLRRRERGLLGNIKQEIVTAVRESLVAEAERFAEGSKQEKQYGEKLARLDKIAEAEVEDSESFAEVRRELATMAGRAVTTPEEYARQLGGLRDDIRSTGLQLDLLPGEIEYAREQLDESIASLSQADGGPSASVEENPAILELDAQIAWSEEEADKLRRMIVSIEHLKKLDAASFEVFAPASEEMLVTDSNRKKLFGAAFAGLTILLAAPMLLFDLVRTTVTPSQKLGNEFGLPLISAQEFQHPTLNKVALQANDPELRLLALRIQQSARQARGSAVLFSSLSDSLATAELTTAIGSCLAAREERVLLIDLEPIGEHRQGNLEMVTPKLESEGSTAGESAERDDHGGDQQESTRLEASDGGPPTGDEEIENGSLARANSHVIGSNGHPRLNRKVGLALALAGATKDPGDLLIEHGIDGIDRLRLGRGELPVEAFASPMMTKLLDRFRNDYSMVLLSGPAAKHVADVQMLAVRCDGTLFVSPNRGEISPLARRTINDLIESRAPIMGIAQVPA